MHNDLWSKRCAKCTQLCHSRSEREVRLDAREAKDAHIINDHGYYFLEMMNFWMPIDDGRKIKVNPLGFRVNKMQGHFKCGPMEPGVGTCALSTKIQHH